MFTIYGKDQTRASSLMYQTINLRRRISSEGSGVSRPLFLIIPKIFGMHDDGQRNWSDLKEEVLIELDQPCVHQMCFSLKPLSNGFSLKRQCRSGVKSCDIRPVWFRLNKAREYFVNNPRLSASMGLFNSSHTEEYSLSSSLRALMSPKNREDWSRSMNSVPEYFSGIGNSPYLPHLVATLLLFFNLDEVLAIMCCISDRCRNPRPYLVSSRAFLEWGSFQLQRYFSSPSEEDFTILDDFMLHGGINTLSLPCFIHLVGCFLSEGCKVFVRYGIAYLKHRKNDIKLLTREAFNLSITLRTFPLSAKTKDGLLNREYPNPTPYRVSSTVRLRTLEVKMEEMLDLLNIQSSAKLHIGSMEPIHSPYSLGWSPKRFVSSFNALGAGLALIIFETVEGATSIFIAIYIDPDNSCRIAMKADVWDGPYASQMPILEIIDGHVVLATEQRALFSVDPGFKRVLIALTKEELKLKNFEIFHIPC
jgi:hypothetical protein